MNLDTKREVGLVLADLVSLILRSPLKLRTTVDMAHKCGYSRFHLSRVFTEMTGETLSGFLRRLRLERAACRIQAGESVGEAASAAGFGSLEAFSRAFKRAYSIPPSTFLGSGLDWRLESPEGLHWNSHWDGGADKSLLRTKFATTLDRSPHLRLAVVRHTGNYGALWKGWEAVPFVEGKSWVTVYYDSMWTCPRRDLMRSDLGFKLPCGDPPGGFRVLEIPAGLTVRTARYVERHERNDAWSYVAGAWPDHPWGWDEYESWPLPFDQVRTRICLRLGE